MVSSDAPLWSLDLQKEALDLLVSIWPSLDKEHRDQLTNEIVEGPPLEAGEDGDAARLQRRRDRAIYARLSLLAGLNNPQMSARGQQKLFQLRGQHPEWHVREVNRPSFAIWTDTDDASPSRHTAADLRQAKVSKILHTLWPTIRRVQPRD
jgi:hypothetical protein